MTHAGHDRAVFELEGAALSPSVASHASFVAATTPRGGGSVEDDTVSELNARNLQRLPQTRSFRRALNASVLSATEWLEAKSTASQSEFGDIDLCGDDDDDEYDGKEQSVDEELGRPTFMSSPGDARLLHCDNSAPLPSVVTTAALASASVPLARSSSPRRRKMMASRLRVILEDQTLFSMYKRLLYLAILINVGLLCLLCTGYFTAAEGKAPLFAVVNVFLCVLFRSEAFFRVVYWTTLAALGHDWVPVQLKWWATAFLQSIGGLHSGTGMASVLWMAKAIYDMSGNRRLATEAMVVVGYGILAMLSVACLGAFPVVRHLFHDTFEFSHRTAGWASLALLWAFVILTARHTQMMLNDAIDGAPRSSVRDVLESMPEYWLAIALTVLVVSPWLSVRRVRVEFENPSNHASIIRLPQPVKAGLLGRIARTPLSDWHAFGIISDNRFTHTILAGAVGDFTKALVRDRPTHIYTRTVKFAGLPYLIHMYQRVLLVATGSGLCPFMSFLIQDTRPEVFVIWVGKNLRQNFGGEIMDGVDAYPADKRIVCDTAVSPRPNILELTIATARAREVEVVIVTSNPTGTRDIVNGCRGAGIAAFGPIWDS